MKLMCRNFFVIALLLAFFGCDDALQKDRFDIFSENYSFDKSRYNWVAGFSDFPVADSSSYELRAGYINEPASGVKALMVSGNNLNDDLFMFYKTRLFGFRPNTEYILTFEVEISTDAKVGTSATGGSTHLKVGATGFEPKSVIDDGYVVMNIDKGNHASGGQDMIVIGEVAAPADSGSGYTLIERSNTQSYNTPCVVRTNSSGELWLIVGTDSSLRGPMKLFYTKISVVFSASN